MTVAFRRTFASLRKHRNYRLFFGQVVSLVGTWMQNIALAWYVVELTHSAVAVGFLAFCRFAPFTVFGLVSGVVADRFDNRRLVMVTQTASMVVALALTALAFSGAEIVWLAYALAAAAGTALVFDAPGRHALTFQMVGRQELPNAIALNASLFNGSRVIGPVRRRPRRRVRRRRLLRDQRSQLPRRADEPLAHARERAREARPAQGASDGAAKRAGGALLRPALAPRPAGAGDDDGREHGRLQLPRARPGADVGDARSRPEDVRPALGMLRRRRVHRRVALRGPRPRELEGAPPRSRRLQPRAARPRSARHRRRVRRSSTSSASASRCGRRTASRFSSCRRRTTSAAASSASTSSHLRVLRRSAGSSRAGSPRSAARSSPSSSPAAPAS